MNLNNYYNEVIKPFTDEDALVAFLNDKDILAKFDDDQRETLMVNWLLDQGYIEVEDEEQLKY